MSSLLLLLLLTPLVSAQSFHWGSCPDPQVQTSLDLQQYMGRWYMIEIIPAFFSIGKCLSGHYTLQEDGTVRVLNSQIYLGRNLVVEGKAVRPNVEEPAKLEVSFFNLTSNYPYRVLSTDYTSYSVVFSCMDFYGSFHLNYAWIFSRSRSLPAERVAFAKELLVKGGVDVSNMQVINQEDCDED